MRRRLYTHQKNTRIPTPEPSTAPAMGMFQSRPFGEPSPTLDSHQEQPDLQTALIRAESYGHNLSRMQLAEPAARTLVQPKMRLGQPLPFQRVTTAPLQAKLALGKPGDKYEQQADQVAAEVANQMQSGVNASSEQQTAQESKHPLSVQRRQKKNSSQPESLNIQTLVQRASIEKTQNVNPELEQSIEHKRGNSQPLSDNIRKPMEQAFGADFSGVKIHTDAQAGQLNQSIQAKAFTTGQDIFFRQGAYAPQSQQGQQLLAHELTHVVQQNGGVADGPTVQRKLSDNEGEELKKIRKIRTQKAVNDAWYRANPKWDDRKGTPDPEKAPEGAYSVEALVFSDLKGKVHYVPPITRPTQQKPPPQTNKALIRHNPENQKKALQNKRKSKDGEMYLIDELNEFFAGYLFNDESKKEEAKAEHLRIELVGPRGTCEDCQAALQKWLRSDLQGKANQRGIGQKVRFSLVTRYLPERGEYGSHNDKARTESWHMGKRYGHEGAKHKPEGINAAKQQTIYDTEHYRLKYKSEPPQSGEGVTGASSQVKPSIVKGAEEAQEHDKLKIQEPASSGHSNSLASTSTATNHAPAATPAWQGPLPTSVSQPTAASTPSTAKSHAPAARPPQTDPNKGKRKKK